MLFPAGAAVPVSAVKVVGTVAPAVIVVAPATPSGFIKLIPEPAINVLSINVPTPVCTTYPVPLRLPKPCKLADKAKVGLPATPFALVIVRLLDEDVKVVPAHVKAPSKDCIPVLLALIELLVGIDHLIIYVLKRVPTIFTAIHPAFTTLQTNKTVSPICWDDKVPLTEVATLPY